jgi:hypothetical protein
MFTAASAYEPAEWFALDHVLASRSCLRSVLIHITCEEEKVECLEREIRCGLEACQQRGILDIMITSW